MRSDRPDTPTGARLLDFKRPVELVQDDLLNACGSPAPATIILVAATRWDYVKLAPSWPR